MIDLNINIFETEEYQNDLQIFVCDTIIVLDYIININKLIYHNELFEESLISLAFTGFSIVANAPPVQDNSILPNQSKGIKWLPA